MKKTKRTALVLYGLCAVMWMIRVITGVVHKEYNDSVGFFILNVFTAFIWIAIFVVWMLKYRSGKDKE